MDKIKKAKILFFLLFCLSAIQTIAAQNKLQIDYTVALANPASRQFHVTTEIKNIKQPRLDLSLPTWTPGWYVVENYGKNLLRFKITDANGRAVPHTMSRKQTWNVNTQNLNSIKIEYDYRAELLGLNQAKIDDDYAFFTGIELFLQAEGHRSEPSTIRFSLPANWKIVTALRETADAMTFTAADYDALVDAPVEMGKFDATVFEVAGKKHTFVANPAGTFSSEKTKSFTEMLSKVALAHSRMFGDLPYEKYVYFYFFRPAESNASGALEHLNSFVAFAPNGDVATPERLIGTASHEFFHLWNVKRIRPIEMFPYDYSRENESPLLWVSEGFTNYYGIVGVYRAGLMTEKDFVNRAAGAMTGVENNEARKYISPAESSVSTWLGYDSPSAFSISYYTQGQNLAALLDLSIRQDTGGAASLDDVMRSLYKDFYGKGKGFSIDDMIGVINRLTKKDYRDFFTRYVFGVEVPDYNRIFSYAGYKVDQTIRQLPVFGFSTRNRNGGLYINRVDPDSPAARAGLRQGDVITKINGADAQNAALGELAGKTVSVSVIRNQTAQEFSMTVGSLNQSVYSINELASPTTQQLKIRQDWLKR